MSFGLRGGFWPTSLPLFQAPHFSIASITGSLVVDRSHNLGQGSERLLSARMLDEYHGPIRERRGGSGSYCASAEAAIEERPRQLSIWPKVNSEAYSI